AAVEEGVIAGGGIILAKAVKVLDKTDIEQFPEDVKAGFRIIKKALDGPVRAIAENAGLDGSIIADKVKNEKDGVGFNALTME
ncbi:MAG: chaperonin GroEL, partial [Desulfobacterales bacterium]|nr:chaperonin GroEL [Desulfobacterales bacterium]